MKANIASHPLELTQAEYDKMSVGGDIGDTWKYMPIGTRFKQAQDPMIIVEVCTGLDMWVDQWGAGTSIPEKGLRWHMAVIKEAA